VVSVEQSSQWRDEVVRRAGKSRLENISVLEGDSALLFPKMIEGHHFSVMVIDGPGNRVAVRDNLTFTAFTKDNRV
jgi:tRNA G46 methylase TrmB